MRSIKSGGYWLWVGSPFGLFHNQVQCVSGNVGYGVKEYELLHFGTLQSNKTTPTLMC